MTAINWHHQSLFFDSPASATLSGRHKNATLFGLPGTTLTLTDWAELIDCHTTGIAIAAKNGKAILHGGKAIGCHLQTEFFARNTLFQSCDFSKLEIGSRFIGCTFIGFAPMNGQPELHAHFIRCHFANWDFAKWTTGQNMGFLIESDCTFGNCSNIPHLGR